MNSFITDKEFVKRTAAWQELEGEPRERFDFFYDNSSSLKSFLSGITLASNDVENLFSKPSVTTIKVRFGLDNQQNNKSFNIILFGTDDLGEVLTPYYIHETQVWKDVSGISGPDDGNIPDVLAKRWKKYWLQKGTSHTIDSSLFMTHYGFVRGYNYPVKELYGALFQFKTFPKLSIHLVLHKFHPINSSTASDEAYTFGVFFQGSGHKSINDHGDETTEDESGYYDLSAPCPRTC
jgi:hypothetical protein